MTIYRAVGGVNKKINSITRAVDGTNRTISNVYRTIEGVNRMVYPIESLILYNYGDLCTEVTGGWTKSGFTYYSYSWKDVTFNSDNMTIYNSYVNGGYHIAGTVNAIDVTKYSKLKVIGKTSTEIRAAVSLISTKDLSSSVAGVPIMQSSSISTYETDISDISGSFYVTFANTSESNVVNTIVYKIWLE